LAQTVSDSTTTTETTTTAAPVYLTRAQLAARRWPLISWTRAVRHVRCRLAPVTYRPARTVDPEYRARHLRGWRARIGREQEKANLCPPAWFVNAILCIKSHEGDWEDGGDPYWGGIQGDRPFLSTYGPDYWRRHGSPRGSVGANGWTNHWSHAEQIQTAWRAYKSGRGFHPWPNTARMCGLL
jgi:hypothetical protein